MSDLLLRASKARPLASASEARFFACKSEARTGPLWQRVAGVIRRCADIMPRIARNAGAMSMTAPFFTISRVFSTLAPGIAPLLAIQAKSYASSAKSCPWFLDDYALPLLRCHTVITRCV